MYTPITIIGTGAAGLLLLHMFQEAGVPAHDITCIDPNFLGGALQTSWAHVISNTQWQKFQTAMTLLHPSWKDTTDLSPSSTTPLSTVICELRNSIRPFLNNCNLISSRVKSVSQNPETLLWTLNCDVVHTTKLLFFCTGSTAKSLGLPIPSIPLEKALVYSELKTIVKNTEKVLVFGTQHSGTLVLKNLEQIGCSTTCVYKNKQPFLFARDGEYDGIKEEASNIADSILNGNYKNLHLIQFSDTPALTSALRKADWVIYAIGFENTNRFLEKSYDPKTGKFPGNPNAWGFGIAFPSSAPDSIHYDVSILAFTEHILNQKVEILETYKAIKLQGTN